MLGYLFVLVAIMTFAQNTLPVFEASSRFIYSWFWFAGPVPLPAGRLVFLLIGANLVASLATRFPFVWDRAGLIAAHLGLIVLVAGAMFGRPASAESVLALAEGEADSWSYDLRRWDVVATPAAPIPAERLPAERFPAERLSGDGVTVDDLARHLGHGVEVIDYVADAATRPEGPDSIVSADNARSIVPAQVRRDTPVPGVVLRIGDELVLLHGADREAVTLPDGASLRLVPRRYPLPARIRLLEFSAEFFDGTQTPRAFTSTVAVETAETVREAVIEMNRPLRLGPYTFYQLGYESERRSSEISVFQVVRSSARWLPYVAGLLVSLGLVTHAVAAIVSRRHP